MSKSPPQYQLSDWAADVRNDLRYGHSQSSKLWWYHALFSVTVRLLVNYRTAKFCRQRSALRLLLPLLRRRQIKLCACDISPDAQLGRNIRLPHPIGIVVGFGVVVEDGATIYQQVTLGSHGRPTETTAYPRICKGATLYAGCKVVGGVTVGEDAVVGANAVVLKDVPAGAVAVGIPAKTLVKAPV